MRLTFLGDQLSADEAAIAAIDRALGTAGYKTSLAVQRAGDMTLNNERMDRNGGGPMPWQEFYGRTARDFIVHDAIITRHAYIQTSHEIQTPAQFNYIYRANRNEAAAARAEIAAMGDKTDALLARKRELETDIGYLWATMAFESIGNRDSPLRLLYRDQLKTGPLDSAKSNDNRPDGARLAAIRAAVVYVRGIEHAVSALADQLESNQQGVYLALRDALTREQQRFQESAATFAETPDVGSGEIGQMTEVVSQAKQIQALCKDICEANRKAADADAAGEERRKQLCRGTLQNSLFTFAETVAQLDGTVTKLAQDWNILPQPGTKSQDQPLPVGIPPAIVTQPAPKPLARASAALAAPIQPSSLDGAPEAGSGQANSQSRQELDAIEARLAAELALHNPASFHYLDEPGHDLAEDRVRAVIDAYPQKYQRLVLTNGKPGVTLVSATVQPKVIPITAKEFVGYAIGKVNRGDSLVLQYVSGKWKSFGKIASESPDSDRPKKSDSCRVAICDLATDEPGGNILQIVPGGTHATPFNWTADRDYGQIILRINSNDKDFSSHPDKGVTYKLWIVPAVPPRP